jgi:hypothetical protein
MVPKKFAPEINTAVPLGPLVGVKVAIVGHPVGTTKLEGLVARPAGVITVTGPVEAPVGTIAEMRVSDSAVKSAATPLKRTDVALERLLPVIATRVPGHPLFGSSVVMLGEDEEPDTTKSSVLVAVPLAFVTVMRPVVAFAGTTPVICVGEFTTKVADVPLNRTAVVPRKFVPEIATVVPLGPLEGVKLMIDGHPGGTVKFAALVAVPSGVVTATGPVVAALGTTAETRDDDSTVKVAETPLKRTAVVLERFVPLIVTFTPGQPPVGLNEPIVGAADAVTVKLDEVVAGPLEVTTVIGPVLAFCGTVAVT